MAKKQAANQARKRNNLNERERLLQEWQQDQRSRYERTVSFYLAIIHSLFRIFFVLSYTFISFSLSYILILIIHG